MFTLLDILKLQTDSLSSALYWLIPSLRLTALEVLHFVVLRLSVQLRLSQIHIN